MQPSALSTANDWSSLFAVALLVMIRLSGLMIFAPIFSSPAIAPRIKAGFVFAVTVLLAPAIAAAPNTRVVLEMSSVLGELGVGLLFGLSLSLLNESLLFAGTLLGMEFSFSLVNLMDPNSMIETPVLGQMMGWFGVLSMMAAGLDRTLLAAFMRSFVSAPVGHAIVGARQGSALIHLAAGVFLAGLQLAAPVIASAMTVEFTVSLIGRLSPQLPAMVIGVPLKTLTSYTVLVASLTAWPSWIEGRFTSLLDAAGRLLQSP